MPVVTVTLVEGYDDAAKRVLETRLTQAVKATIDAPLDGITVVVNEVAPANYMRGGRSRTPGPPVPSAAAVARAFLEAMEARDFGAAKAYLAEGFAATYPGGVRFERLEDVAAWAKQRYRSVRKSIERVDEAPTDEGVVVYCSGTLAGEWIDGAPFAGIRFVDRFTVAGGRIVDQMVWNDMAEARAAG